jgi:precorrin-2 methylase
VDNIINRLAEKTPQPIPEKAANKTVENAQKIRKEAQRRHQWAWALLGDPGSIGQAVNFQNDND